MSYWKQYTSPLGYVSNGNKIDTYGVDHSGFTTRDELQYQNARINRENNLMTQMQKQGITDYPQYTTIRHKKGACYDIIFRRHVQNSTLGEK